VGRLLNPMRAVLVLILPLFLLLAGDLWALSITETRMFSEGPYLFKMEFQVQVRGSVRKNPSPMTSLKIKIKNDRASSRPLVVKTIRVYLYPQVSQDIETRGYPITPSQWVTKYYRLPKDKQPLLGDQATIEVAFETFAVRFNPRTRKFQGPIK
jgi:hypothetical protein